MTSAPSKFAGAVFLDRDGTLVEDVGYLMRPEDIIWYPETIPALQLLAGRFKLFVVSNQSGVALGELSLDEVTRVNDHIHARLAQEGVFIQKWYVCPHSRDEQCECIKPRPFFLEQAAREFGVDLTQSFAIGDHPHDLVFAENVGGTGLYVLTGHGEKHRSELLPSTPVYADILEAARWIVAR
jgi:D-glycero-D-manno-heptose 1,7-bisphosphate phosphatase